jgi:hypothetical protein
MKLLEPEFIRNADHCGDHKFVQLKKENGFALYCRYRMNGDVFGYEMFKIKVVKAGSSLPGGGTVEEDYEVYPTKHAFGKSASYYSKSNIKDIYSAYERFVRTFQSQSENENSDSHIDFKIPDGLFSIKTLVTLNSPKTYLDCYQYVKEELGKSIEFVKKEFQGRGKPASMYKKIQ